MVGSEHLWGSGLGMFIGGREGLFPTRSGRETTESRLPIEQTWRWFSHSVIANAGDKEVELCGYECGRGLVSRRRYMPAVTSTTCNRKVLWS